MKKIHVELEFLRLEFHHFIFLLLPHILQTQGSSLCRSEGPIVQSELQRSSFFLCSSFLFRSVLRQIFLPVLLQVCVQSSNRSSNVLRPSFFLYSSFFVTVLVLHQIVLPVLLQVCFSSSTKIESQRLGFAF